MRVFDIFPFFNELDVLEIRLNELWPVVDKFVILECRETFGGDLKPLYLQQNWSRFVKYADKIVHVITDRIEPELKHTLRENVPGVSANDIRTIGRLREKNMRDDILPHFRNLCDPQPNDVLMFSDCDEIPRRTSVAFYLNSSKSSITRFKQRTYYYNVNTMIDYGRDVCSRPRIGRFCQLMNDCDRSLYNFRMYRGKDPQCPSLEEGGWHFSYFGGSISKLHEKVDALNPFLSEYKLFGDAKLAQDIVERKDLHHRPLTFSELPEVFTEQRSDDPMLPEYYLANREKFKHFTIEDFRRKYGR